MDPNYFGFRMVQLVGPLTFKINTLNFNMLFLPCSYSSWCLIMGRDLLIIGYFDNLDNETFIP
jgi:hypothetical protein